MGYRYDNYCFETTQEIAERLQNTIVPGASGYVYYSSCANGGLVGTVYCNHSYKVYNTTSEPIAAGLATFTLPTCSTVGYLPPSNELNTFAEKYLAFDAELFGYIIGATIAAYALGMSTGLISRLIIGPKQPD